MPFGMRVHGIRSVQDHTLSKPADAVALGWSVDAQRNSTAEADVLVVAGCALLLGDPQDRARGRKGVLVAVSSINGEVGGAAHHHQCQRAVRRVPNDEQVGGTVCANERHHVLAFVFPPRPVEVGWPLERLPVDVDSGDLAEQRSQDGDEVG